MKKIVIAIDGYSSCGKSTMAKELAKKIGYIYVDSGAMYRAVTLYCLNHNLITDNKVDEETLRKEIKNIKITFRINPETGQPETYLNGVNVEKEIRSLRVSSKVSLVSTFDFVRSALVELQQSYGTQKGIVMDGRDIGTTVFPEAELKIFVTATPEIRAQRRYEELKAKGEGPTFESILANVRERDHIDQTREVSPLSKAEDAYVLDNSTMTRNEQNEWLMNKYKEAISKN
ncbi:MAG: (d)CMP kinase [Bacteroides sp.]|nr:(d)CMP kinase [Bacteroides sp.]